jgi:Tol biopolymer transport system component
MTSRTKQRVLTWLLSGAAFAIVLGSAGCTGRNSPLSETPDPYSALEPTAGAAAMTAEAPAPAKVSFDPVTHAESMAPQINIFGEFDGHERPAPRRGGEAGFQQHTYVDEGLDGDVAVDPKGQWLVFSSTRHSERAEIYLQKVDGLSVTQLTSDDSDDAFPVFSPDGQRVAFCSTRSGNWDIYVMDVDGKNTIQVTSSPMQEIHPSFSPDGNRLVYCAMSNRSGNWELWTVNLETSEKRMIGFGLFPTWSPNKEKDQIAFQKARARGSRWYSLWRLDLVDGEARWVTEVAVSSNAAIVCPSWSPDGKRLSFSTIVEPARTSNGKPMGQQDIWTINADGTNRRRITDGNGICATPFWGPDNRIYFVSDRGGAESVWSARADQTVGTATAGSDMKEIGN